MTDQVGDLADLLGGIAVNEHHRGSNLRIRHRLKDFCFANCIGTENVTVLENR